MKVFKRIIFAVLSICIVLLLSTKFNYSNSTAFDSIVTFLSITSGFVITALSIIATSAFSKKLYQLEDSKDNSKTLLHILVGQFKTSMIVFICGIASVLLFKFLPASTTTLLTIKSYAINFTTILNSLVWFFTGLSFFVFVDLFYTFSKFVIKSATN